MARGCGKRKAQPAVGEDDGEAQELDDKYVAAVSWYGDGPRVETCLGSKRFSIRWVEGRSLEALRRLSRLELGDEAWEGNFENAWKHICKTRRLPPAWIIQTALCDIPDCFAVFRPDAAATADPPCGMVVRTRRWAFDETSIAVVGDSAELADVPLRDRVAWCVEAAHGNITNQPRKAFHDRMVPILGDGRSVKARKRTGGTQTPHLSHPVL